MALVGREAMTNETEGKLAEIRAWVEPPWPSRHNQCECCGYVSWLLKLVAELQGEKAAFGWESCQAPEASEGAGDGGY